MDLGDVANKFLNNDSFTNSRSSKNGNFPSFYKWGQKINNFNSCFKNSVDSCLFNQFWCGGVDASLLFCWHTTQPVNWVCNHIKHSAQCLLPNRYLNLMTSG